jgi:mannose/fructose/sorbose-specific phosphotransferase system IIA component
MVNILLVSHGKLAEGVLSAYTMFCGETSQVKAVGLTAEGGVEVFREALDAAIAEMSAEAPLLVMADLPGGTPYNESYVRYLQNPEKLRLVAGLNLPMVVETGVMSQAVDDIDVLVQTALTAGANGVMAPEAPESDTDEDDEDDLF